MAEYARQKQGRANAFFFNNLELADPENKQKNTPKAVKSNDIRLNILNGRLTQLNITLQQQLATQFPEQFRIVKLPSLYSPPDLPPLPTFLLVPKGSYSAFTTDGNVPFYLTGNVRVQCRSTFVGGTQWGPHQLFDGIRTDSDFVNDNNDQQFLLLTFPARVYIKQIFFVTRNQGVGLPNSITLTVDGASVGTYSQRTVTNAMGFASPVYNGLGFYFEPNRSGTVWRFDFPTGFTAFGEMEMYGYKE